MKLILFILVFFAINTITIAQKSDQDLKKFIEKSSDQEILQLNTTYLLEGYFHQSIILIDHLLKKDEENANFNYRKGYALFSYKADPSISLPFFEKAAGNSKKFYDMMSSTEKGAPFDIYYYIGNCYHRLDDIDKAEENYNNYLSKGDKKTELYALTELALKQCKVARKMLKNPKNFQVLNLGNEINGEFPDYSPFISIDGYALYFTSRRIREDSSNIDFREPGINIYNEDVYVSYKSREGIFGNAEVMDVSEIDRNDATVFIHPDEREVYLYRSEVPNGNIYKSQFENYTFQEVTKVDIPGVNTDHWEPHYTISSDGNTIYFVSDRPGGYGGRDIYRLIKLPNGEWSKPLNLGPKINSEYDEDGPFLAVDNKSLYFASNGEKSMGGFDIFLSIIDENGEWSDPVNLGSPLNSTSDDLFYTTTADGLTGYLTSYRNDSHGEKDIYEIKNDFLGVKDYLVLYGDVIEVNGKPLPEDLKFIITCKNCNEEDIQEFKPRLSDNRFVQELKKDREYEIVAVSNGEELYKDKLFTPASIGFNEIERRFELDLNDGTLKRITYDTDELFYTGIPVNYYGDLDKLTPKFICIDCENNYAPLEITSTFEDGKFKEAIKRDKNYLITLTDENGKLVYNELLKTPADKKADDIIRYIPFKGESLIVENYESDFAGLIGTLVYDKNDKADKKVQFKITCTDCDANEYHSFFLDYDENGELKTEFIEVMRKNKNYNVEMLVNDKTTHDINILVPDSDYIRREFRLDLINDKFEIIDAVIDIDKIDFKQYFNYNITKIETEKEPFIEFITKLENYAKYSNVNVELFIFSSASKVPTETFKTNEKLTKARAKSAEKLMMDELSKRNLTDKVDLVIKSAIVQGPNYVWGTAENEEKYEPFQYVYMNLTGKEPETSNIETNITSQTISNDEKINLSNLEDLDNYIIISGVFKNKENATKMVQNLQSTNNQSKPGIFVKNNLYHVYVDSFNEFNLATNKTNEIKKNIASDAWLMKNL